MSTYLDIIPREITLLILENLKFNDIYSCIDHIDDVLSREFLMIHRLDFRNFYVESVIQKLNDQRLSNQKLLGNILLVYIKLDDEIKKDYEMNMSIIDNANYARSRGYYDENGTYNDRILIYIRKNIEKEYADLLLEYSMELSTINYLHIDFLEYLFEKDAKYYIYLALQKFYHRFDYLKILGTQHRKDLSNINRFNYYLYRIGNHENIYCDEHKSLNMMMMEFINCKECMMRVTYPPVKKTCINDNRSIAVFLDHSIMLMYLIYEVPSLLVLIYYIDSLINSDMGRNNELEEQLMIKINKEYQLSHEHILNLFENYDKLRHLFPNKERVEYRPLVSMRHVD